MTRSTKPTSQNSDRPLDEQGLADHLDAVLSMDPASRQLMVFVLDRGCRPYQTIAAVDELPERPTEPALGYLLSGIQATVEEVAPGGSVVLVLARPGTPVVDVDDMAWSKALRAGATQIGLPLRGPYVAAAGQLHPLGPWAV